MDDRDGGAYISEVKYPRIYLITRDVTRVSKRGVLWARMLEHLQSKDNELSHTVPVDPGP